MSKQLNDKLGIGVDGHVLIKDAETGEVLLNKHNAINFENFALAVASLMSGNVNLSNGNSFRIAQMAFGNGGTVVDTTGIIEYRTPNVDAATGVLYNQTYKKDIAIENSIVVPYPNESYSDMVFTVTLNYDEPADQMATDTATTKSDFVFDEISLVSESGLTLTHLIFHPIQKSSNRKVQVIYTIRIRAGQ